MGAYVGRTPTFVRQRAVNMVTRGAESCSRARKVSSSTGVDGFSQRDLVASFHRDDVDQHKCGQFVISRGGILTAAPHWYFSALMPKAAVERMRNQRLHSSVALTRDPDNAKGAAAAAFADAGRGAMRAGRSSIAARAEGDIGFAGRRSGFASQLGMHTSGLRGRQVGSRLAQRGRVGQSSLDQHHLQGIFWIENSPNSFAAATMGERVAFVIAGCIGAPWHRWACSVRPMQGLCFARTRRRPVLGCNSKEGRGGAYSEPPS